jgi:hypothetical protein
MVVFFVALHRQKHVEFRLDLYRYCYIITPFRNLWYCMKHLLLYWFVGVSFRPAVWTGSGEGSLDGIRLYCAVRYALKVTPKIAFCMSKNLPLGVFLFKDMISF